MMGKEKLKVKKCAKCEMAIKPEDGRYVDLSTHEPDDSLVESVLFHLSCFRSWHDEKARDKAQSMVKKSFGMAVEKVSSAVKKTAKNKNAA